MDRITGLDHVGIAVRDLDEAVETFGKLLGEDAESHRIDPGYEYDEDGNLVEEMRFAYLETGNGVQIELLEPGEVGSGAIGSYIQKFGEGLHHISFWISPKSEFGELFATLSELGFTTVGDRPWRSDPEADRDNVYTYIHPSSAHGTLIELITPFTFEDGEMKSADTAEEADPGPWTDSDE
ncbi:VOC family protein [Saliphagus sp. GCM10025308]